MSQLIELNEVQFNGDHLGGMTTWLPGKVRWIEIDLYRTVSGTYVGEVIGCSDVEGEKDFVTTHEAGHPQALIESLQYKGKLSKPSIQALEAASEADPKLAEAFTNMRVRFIE